MVVAAGLEATRTIRVCPFCGCGLHRRYRDLGDRLGTVSGTFSVDECTGCGAAVVNPSPTGDVSALYPPNYLSAEEEGAVAAASVDLERRYRYNQYRFDFGLLARSTGEQIGAVPSYVDLGCGSGERVTYAAVRGCPRAVGVDKFDFAKTAAQRRVEIVNAELRDFRPGQRFHLASLFHVLEHLEHPGEVIDHIRESVLEPGGHLIIQVPNYAALDRRWFGARWFGLDVPRHLWHFTPAAIGRLLNDHGYNVVGLHQRNAPLHPVTIVPSLFPSVDVQRVWTDRAHGPGYKRMMQVLWAGLTLLSVPVCVLENLLGQASMLTVIAQPR